MTHSGEKLKSVANEMFNVLLDEAQNAREERIYQYTREKVISRKNPTLQKNLINFLALAAQDNAFTHVGLAHYEDMLHVKYMLILLVSPPRKNVDLYENQERIRKLEAIFSDMKRNCDSFYTLEIATLDYSDYDENAFNVLLETPHVLFNSVRENLKVPAIWIKTLSQ